MKKRFLTLTFTFLVVFLLDPQRVYAGTTYDLNISSNYNLRIDGAAASDGLGFTSTNSGDLDQNGVNDLLIGSLFADNNSRNNSGSLYVIYDSLLSKYTGTGNNIDLAISTNYNIRIDGANAGGSTNAGFSTGGTVIADIDNDDINDLVILDSNASFNGKSESGSVYVISGNILRQYVGTGNVIDMAVSSNYSIRFDGASSGDYLGRSQPIVTDLNHDSEPDIVFPARFTDYNGKDKAGSIYILYSEIIKKFPGTGNNVDMADTNNFSIRFDGGGDNFGLGYGNTLVGDIDGDSNKDILISLRDANSYGALYIIKYPLFSNYLGTGNTVDLANSSNYSFLITSTTSYVSAHCFTIGYLDGDNKADIVAGGLSNDFNSRNDSGSFYVIMGSSLAPYPETGNVIGINDSNFYSVRFDGSAANERLPYGGARIEDLDGDSKMDLTVGALLADYNSRTNSGSYFVFSNNLINTYTGFGNNVDLGDNSKFWKRFDGPIGSNLGSTFHSYDFDTKDVSGDGIVDYILSFPTTDFNSRSSSGSVYIIYNFPHTYTAQSNTGEVTARNTTTVTGTVSAPNSITPIAGVQWSLSNNPIGTWNACTADDGAFDELSENYTCTDVSGFGEDGVKNISIRAYDPFNVYTGSSFYGGLGSFIFDTNEPSKLKIGVSENGLVGVGKEALYTDSTTPKLYFDTFDRTTDTAFIKVSEHKDFRGLPWVRYDGDLKVKLEGTGERKLYIKFKDEAGNVSDTYVQKVIVDDTPLTLKTIGNFAYESQKYTEYFYTLSDVSFKGSGPSGVTVKLVVDGTETDSVQIDEDNSWVLNASLSQKNHEIHLDAGSGVPIKFHLTIDETGQSFPSALKSETTLTPEKANLTEQVEVRGVNDTHSDSALSESTVSEIQKPQTFLQKILSYFGIKF